MKERQLSLSTRQAVVWSQEIPTLEPRPPPSSATVCAPAHCLRVFMSSLSSCPTQLRKELGSAVAQIVGQSRLCLPTKVTIVVADLHVQHCNDFFSVGNGAWSAISCVKSLRRLAIEDLHCRLDADSLKELATIPQVSACCDTKQEF